MNLYLFVAFAALLVSCDCACNKTEACKRDSAFSFLDVAANMIQRIKENYIECEDAKLNLPSKPIDCEEWLLLGRNKSGSYKIWPKSRVLGAEGLDVYCDMETDGGGWTVIQRRGNYMRPKDYFYKDWANYKAGFGNIDKDFWLGNDNIFALTNQKLCSVRFDLKDVAGSKKYALYDTFWIGDEIQKYTLHIEDYSGDAGDSMTTHNKMKFLTKDADNDAENKLHCSQLYKGAWWYAGCHSANLNGLYHRGKHESYADGVNWKTWKGYYESLDFTEIKIRSKSFKQKSILHESCETPRS